MRAHILCVIPARGGSKSVPRKNLLPVAGKPLLVHTIRHALECPGITRTLVSTDDDEIAAVAAEHGAEVPFRRPPELATDDATDYVVLRHALEWLAREENYRPALLVHLRATEPVRDPDRVAVAIRFMLAHPEADSLRSVSVASESPYKMWRLSGVGLVPVVRIEGQPDAHSLPRQVLPLVYRQNGYVDVIRPATILEKGSICGDLVLPFVIDEPVPGIDYPDQVHEVERALDAGSQRARKEETWVRHPA